jgi:copper(I)-binding protein
MNKRIWLALALAGAAVGPAACGEQPAAPEAGPDAPEGIAASKARLMLPAVAGNPGAVYFELANTGTRDRVLRAASVVGAGTAMMHTTVEGVMQEALQVMAKAGETVKFEPGGMHVMVSDLADTVVAGGKAEVTLTFVGGDKISFPAEVRAAGDAR